MRTTYSSGEEGETGDRPNNGFNNVSKLYAAACHLISKMSGWTGVERDVNSAESPSGQL